MSNFKNIQRGDVLVTLPADKTGNMDQGLSTSQGSIEFRPHLEKSEMTLAEAVQKLAAAIENPIPGYRRFVENFTRPITPVEWQRARKFVALGKLGRKERHAFIRRETRRRNE